jgi:tetratricopeptide (TPR) repeat protein
MIKFYFLTKLFFIFLIMCINVNANETNFFAEGQKLYEVKKYKEAKFFFEKDIVFNPKEYKSYLYLAKIFKQNDNDEELEKNLNNVLLLNPNNDEAIYLLILLKIKQSDYTKSNELIDKFKKVCNLFCNKENELKSKLDKINADNEQIKN